MIEDSYCACLALKRFLNSNNKKQGMSLFVREEIPPALRFLAGEDVVQSSINSAREIVIAIDISQRSVKKLSYEKTKSLLNIYVVPEQGDHISERDIRINLSKFNHDLIVTIGLEDLTLLKETFENNAQFFYETPIINIDESAANEHFGEVNVIEPTASSCSEIITRMLRKWDENLIVKIIATPLLAGIISATNNFQNLRTKPNALYEAAFLMSREADQQEIIKSLFKTKPFEMLKLYGMAMAKLSYHKNMPIVSATLTSQDFLQSGAEPTAISQILAELKNSFMPTEVLILFWEEDGSWKGAIHTSREESIKLLHQTIGGERHGNTIFLSLATTDPVEQKKIIDTASYALEKLNVS